MKLDIFPLSKKKEMISSILPTKILQSKGTLSG
jgi:hypothetical protein